MKRTEMIVRIPTEEYNAFKEYCQEKEKPMTSVLRGFIRSVIPPDKRASIMRGPEPLELTNVQFLRATTEDAEDGPLADTYYTPEERDQVRAYEATYGQAGRGKNDNAEPVETLSKAMIKRICARLDAKKAEKQ